VEKDVRKKPLFIRRKGDYMILTDINLPEKLPADYHFTAKRFTEDDGSVTLLLNEIDLAENAGTEDGARQLSGRAIKEHADDFHNEFDIWSTA
jgi:hypothetical protein